tara:strand:+ start:51 stop:845 length:795 start_codon:yes stop_codon:yes gene_type:complete
MNEKIDELEIIKELDELRSNGIEIYKPNVRRKCPIKRPCAYVSCKYNNYLDVNENGKIIYNYPGIEPWEVPKDESCVLDIAEDINEEISEGKRISGLSNEEIANILNCSRETIRLIEIQAISKLRYLYKEVSEENCTLNKRSSLFYKLKSLYGEIPVKDICFILGIDEITLHKIVKKFKLQVKKDNEYTSEEIIKDFNISKRIFMKWIDKGLPYREYGNDVIIKKGSIIEFFCYDNRTFYLLKPSPRVYLKYGLTKVDKYVRSS